MGNCDEVKKRIRLLIDKSGMSLNDLSIKIGREQTYLFQFLNRKYPQRLNEIDRRKLALLLNVAEQELTDIKLNNPQENDLATIEIIDAVASCGNGIENFNPVPIGKQLISINNLKDITSSKPENIKIIKIRGDSMEPTINDSDVIWVDVSHKMARGDAMYVLCIRDELFVKRVRIDFIHNKAVVLSDNPKYPPIEVENPDDIRVVGKVIAINKMLG